MEFDYTLVQKYNQRVPRYTSYPPVPVWNGQPTEFDRFQSIDEDAANSQNGWALLPCGANFVALAGAATTGTAVSLFLLDLIIARVRFAQKSLYLIAPWFMASLGILVLVRKMDLDIPYLSPGLNLLKGNVSGCN